VNALAQTQLEYSQDLIGTNILDCHPEPARARLNRDTRKRAGEYLHN